MKLQLIILAVFVVATLAHRHRDGDEDQVGSSRRQFRGRRRNDNQIAANAEDAELEDSISAEVEAVDGATEKKKGCGHGLRRGERRGERRGSHRREFNHDMDWHIKNGIEMAEGDNHHHEFKHDPEWHQRNGVPMKEEGSQHHHHNAEWHEKHGRPVPDEDSEVERKHHRHHHHHHHRNRTTTTTTTPSAPTTVPNE